MVEFNAEGDQYQSVNAKGERSEFKRIDFSRKYRTEGLEAEIIATAEKLIGEKRLSVDQILDPKRHNDEAIVVTFFHEMNKKNSWKIGDTLKTKTLNNISKFADLKLRVLKILMGHFKGK